MTVQGVLAPGTVISGAYRIVRPLSQGGMGAVFVVEHVTTRKPRALKIMHGELLRDPSLRDRFVQEAQLGGRLESEHVVEVVDAGFDDQLRTPWIAMELLEGESLADRCARGPVPAAEVHELFQQLCHALAAAHQAGVVHRDLKPENVFVARARRVGVPFTVKVLDFGIAKVVAEAKATRKATAAMGTPLWMAPEQTEAGNRIGPQTDVWALGLIAFRLLTGRFYWLEAYQATTNIGAILTEMLVTPLVPASHRAAQLSAPNLLPPGFDEWFARCVDRDPARRWPDASHAWHALAPVLQPFVAATQPSTQPSTQIAQPSTQPGHAGWGSGTMVYGGSTPNMTAPAHGVPQPPTFLHGAQGTVQGTAQGTVQAAPQLGAHATPPHLAMQSTPAGVAMGTPPPRTKQSSGARSFALGLGSVLLLGGLALAAVKLAGSRETSNPASGGDEPAPVEAKPLNKWIRVAGAKKGLVLGLDADGQSPLIRGFRPARKVEAPTADFEIQQHEVTWAELDAFLASLGADGADKHKVPKPSEIPGDEKDRDKLPATGIGWATASAYCKSIGANLPTEEQWELAARGKDRRKFAWGSEGIDLHRTRVFAGAKGTVLPVMSNDQDQTPADDPVADAIFDLMGNAQEWTSDVYQDDFPEQDEGWAQSGGVTFRVVRGLPLGQPVDPAVMARMSAAHREPACATGTCAPGGKGGSGGSSGDKTVLVRTAFSVPAPEDGGASRLALAKVLGELRTDLGACLEKGTDPRGYVVDVEYTLPLRKVPLCRASDGYNDPMECCTGKKCPHAPHRLIKYDPVKVTVSNPPDASVPDSSGPAGTCAKAAIDKKLVGLAWGEGADDWTATIWVHSVTHERPAGLRWIGFRCARPVPKGP